jgi:hypothetical protein
MAHYGNKQRAGEPQRHITEIIRKTVPKIFKQQLCSGFSLTHSLSLCVYVSDEVRKVCKKHRERKIYEFSHNNIFMAIKRHGSEL